MKGKIKAENLLYLGVPSVSMRTSDTEREVINLTYETREVTMLRNHGFNVDIARNASDAYGSILLNPYDALILDPQCSRGNFPLNNGQLCGMGLLRQICGKNVPTIIVTSIASSSLDQEFLDNGAFGVIKRPADIVHFTKYLVLKH